MKLMIDLRTGEPVLDLEGRLERINIERSFRQYLDVLFQTPIITEQFLPNWGVDIRSILQASGTPAWDSTIQYLIANALSEQNEHLVDSIQSIELSRDGNELSIEVHVLSKYGTSTRNLVEINV